MSIVNLLPPICDPVDGHYLLDGCYMHNVPGEIMKKTGVKFIIAQDVAALDDRDLFNYGDHLSGWWVFWNQINFFGQKLKIPNQADIQQRLTFCSHYKNLELLQNDENCEYIKPDIKGYTASSVRILTLHKIIRLNLTCSLLQFHKFKPIHDIGYHHARTFFAGIRIVHQKSPVTPPSIL